MEECKVLIGRDSICRHLNVGKSVFYDLVYNAGLPASKQGGRRRWVSNMTLLDEWSRKVALNKTPDISSFNN